MIEHGGNVEKVAKQLGVAISDLIDFSANINPLGIPDSVKAIWGSVLNQMDYYPDIDYTTARTAIANHENVTLAEVLLSNGAAQSFFELAQAIQPQKLLVLAPTFLEYKQAFYEAEYIEVPLSKEKNYSWCFDDLKSGLDQLESGDVVLICNPNNPTGTLVESSELLTLAAYAKERGIYCIFDEAFMHFIQNQIECTFVPYLKDYTNVIVVKSLTKFYAIPGLRLGYALSFNHDLFNHIKRIRVPWSVNGISSLIVPVLLQDEHYAEQTMTWIQSEREFLYRELQTMDEIDVIEPSVNYIFFEYKKNSDLKEALLKKGIMIRSCANYTNTTSQHYRVAVKSREDNIALINALKAIR